jgi:hypothetical protein
MKTRITFEPETEKRQTETRIPLNATENALYRIVRVGVEHRIDRTRRNLSKGN